MVDRNASSRLTAPPYGSTVGSASDRHTATTVTLASSPTVGQKASTSSLNGTRKPGWQSRRSTHSAVARSLIPVHGCSSVCWQYCSIHDSRSASDDGPEPGSTGIDQTLTWTSWAWFKNESRAGELGSNVRPSTAKDHAREAGRSVH